MKICQYLDMNKSLVSLFSDSQYRSQRYHFTLETINKHHETITNRYQTSHDLLTYLHMSNTASTYQQPQSLQPHSQSRLAHSTLSEQHSVYLPAASVTTATQSVTSCTLYTVRATQRLPTRSLSHYSHTVSHVLHTLHRQSKTNTPPNFCPHLRRILSDFQKVFHW